MEQKISKLSASADQRQIRNEIKDLTSAIQVNALRVFTPLELVRVSSLFACVPRVAGALCEMKDGAGASREGESGGGGARN